MSDMTDNRSGRVFLFGLMYFVQGAIYAYVFVFNNLYLRAFGATAQQLAIFNGLLTIPLVLKIFIGLFSDRVSLFGRGHRLPYIIIGLVVTAAGAGLATLIPPVEQYPLFLAVVMFLAFGLVLFDTVIDGLAIDVTPDHEKGIIQGAMVLGRAFGVVLLAAVYGRLIDQFGWEIVFYIAGAFCLLPIPFLLRIREPATRHVSQTFSWQAVQQLWRPEIILLTLYAIIYSFVVYGANAILTLFANEELGASLVQVGDVAALAGLGMVIGGGLAMFIERRIAIWVQGLWTTVIVTIVLCLMAFTTTLDNIVVMVLAWGICLSATELVFVTVAMLKSDPRMGAGMFAIFMAISNIGTGIGQATTTGLIDTINFSWIFAGLAILNLFALPVLARMQAMETTPTTPENSPLPL